MGSFKRFNSICKDIITAILKIEKLDERNLTASTFVKIEPGGIENNIVIIGFTNDVIVIACEVPSPSLAFSACNYTVINLQYTRLQVGCKHKHILKVQSREEEPLSFRLLSYLPVRQQEWETWMHKINCLLPCPTKNQLEICNVIRGNFLLRSYDLDPFLALQKFGTEIKEDQKQSHVTITPSNELLKNSNSIDNSVETTNSTKFEKKGMCPRVSKSSISHLQPIKPVKKSSVVFEKEKTPEILQSTPQQHPLEKDRYSTRIFTSRVKKMRIGMRNISIPRIKGSKKPSQKKKTFLTILHKAKKSRQSQEDTVNLISESDLMEEHLLFSPDEPPNISKLNHISDHVEYYHPDIAEILSN